MADHYYGVSPGGGQIGSVSTGTSTTSKNVELRVADGTADKTSLLLAIDAIRAYVVSGNAPT